MGAVLDGCKNNGDTELDRERTGQNLNVSLAVAGDSQGLYR